MEIKIPRGLIVFLGIVLLVGLGTFVGAAGYRAGPYRQLSMQLTGAQAELSTAKQTIATRDQRVVELEGRVRELERSLQEAKRSLQETGGKLTEREQQLSQTEAARRAAAQQAKQRGQLLLTKERDIYILRTCMVGVSATLGYVLDRDYDSAIYSIRSVERECRAASKLVE